MSASGGIRGALRGDDRQGTLRGAARPAALVALSAVVIALLAFLAYSIADSYRGDREVLRERFQERARISTASLEALVGPTLASSQAQAEQALSGRSVSSEDLRQLSGEGSFASRGFLLDKSGTVIAASPPGAAEIGKPLPGASATVRSALADGDAALSELSKPGEGERLLDFVIPFDTAQGRRVFVSRYSASVLGIYLGSTLSKLRTVGSGNAYVLDGDAVLAAATAQPGATNLPAELSDRISEASGSLKIDGTSTYFVSEPVAQTPWRMVFTTSEDDLYAPAASNTLAVWLVFGALGLLIGVSAWLFSRVTRGSRELAEANRELEVRNAEVERATRAKSEFLANMSHELRTPLNSVIGFAELIHDGKVGEVSERQREYLGDILTSSRHLLELINDVLDLSRVEAGRLKLAPELIDSGALATEAVESMRQIAAEKQIRVSSVIDPRLGEVMLDPAKLKQVLFNYLSNAIKFTPTGGAVEVRLDSDANGGLVLAVSDTGIGISRPDQARLFREFEQLDGGSAKEHQGTGLGLALTKRLVEAQGGRVWVESTVGRGSTFFAELPGASREGNGDQAPGDLEQAGDEAT